MAFPAVRSMASQTSGASCCMEGIFLRLMCTSKSPSLNMLPINLAHKSVIISAEAGNECSPFPVASSISMTVREMITEPSRPGNAAEPMSA